MKITSTKLEVLAVRRSQYPDEERSEFLLVGRSNVGKSSFINSICNDKNLAHISSKPGKTKTLNFFLINNSFYLVDAPGYGYANVNKDMQKKFGLMIEEYLSTRKELKRVFLLIDFRHAPTENDKLMYDFLKYYKIPTTIIFTKYDKVSTSRKNKALKRSLSELAFAEHDNYVLYSSVTKEGISDVLKVIEDNLWKRQ